MSSPKSQPVEQAPRNPRVEAAWLKYRFFYMSWAKLLETTIFSLSHASAEQINAVRERRDHALMEYFEAFDADQVKRFG